MLAIVTNMLFFSIRSLAEKQHILYDGEIEVIMPDDYEEKQLILQEVKE